MRRGIFRKKNHHNFGGEGHYGSTYLLHQLFYPYFSGASKQLAMVIEGEALLNDGAAIVFFNVFLKLTTTEVGLSGI